MTFSAQRLTKFSCQQAVNMTEPSGKTFGRGWTRGETSEADGEKRWIDDRHEIWEGGRSNRDRGPRLTAGLHEDHRD